MDIMQAIIDIEEKARKISESAQNLRDEYEDEINREINLRKQETENKISEHLKQYKLRIDAECKEEIEALEKVYEGKLEALSKTCKAKKDVWVKTITQNITGTSK